MPITINREDGTTTTITGEEFTSPRPNSRSEEEPKMAQGDLLIHIDDVTGRQLRSPADARNGGSHALKGKSAIDWLEANPDLTLANAKEAEKAEDKAAAKSEDKSVEKPETKAKT